MGKLRSKFRIGFKNGMLKKAFKAQWGHKWYKVSNPNEKAFLRDVKYFPEELTDFLMELKPLRLEDAIKAVNDWLHLESAMTGFPRKRFVVGTAEDLFRIISSQRIIYLITKQE